MTQVTDFDTAVADAIGALETAEAALQQAKAIKDAIDNPAISTGLKNNADGSHKPEKQQAVEFAAGQLCTCGIMSIFREENPVLHPSNNIS